MIFFLRLQDRGDKSKKNSRSRMFLKSNFTCQFWLIDEINRKIRDNRMFLESVFTLMYKF